MAISSFNTLIHAPKRLRICATLMPMDSIEFRVLRELLEVSDSVLSKQIKLLEKVSYLSVSKRTVNGRQQTWIALSDTGRKAFSAHVRALKKILA